MMVVMNTDSTQENISKIVELLETHGLHAQVNKGESLTVVSAIGDVDRVRELAIEGLPGVEKVVPISPSYKLASLEFTHHHSIFNINDVLIGEGNFTVIAGPCTVENREQTINTARLVKESGAHMLRGGAFKPRTSPFAFQGLGKEAIDILKEAKEITNMPVVSEMTDSSQIDILSDVVDVIQIGARNMQNYGLLQAAGELGKPVLLKRGLSASANELLQAADYILKENNPHVILCERGIRSFETATRFTLDLGIIPWLKAHSHLPVIVDPSHAAGTREYVLNYACAAAAIGADGIIVETTENPETARCDGPQQIYAHEFKLFLNKVFSHAKLAEKNIQI